eukprot:TRINITY_DN33454_c0_g1_i1.p1 TRINITY_DN33454_c0_g1~~TRINITY_DN33454_c0_g1_i1.p1  ORF type:complete len:236 (+),score=37.44 TRINITY_DN33454_c0_g1_i1:119-826(+)
MMIRIHSPLARFSGSILLALCFAHLASPTAASRFGFVLAPNTVECFHEEVAVPDASVYGSVLVSSGGRLDVHVTLTDPDNDVIFEDRHTASTRFVTPAHERGRYTLCISNEFAVTTEKHVIVHFETEAAIGERSRPHGSVALGPKDGDVAKDTTFTEDDPLRRALVKAHSAVEAFIEEQTVSRARHQMHLELVSRARTLFDLSGVVLAVVVLFVGVAQARYFRWLINKRAHGGRA